MRKAVMSGILAYRYALSRTGESWPEGPVASSAWEKSMTRRSVMMLVVALVGAASAGAASPAQAATQRPATPAAASAGTWTSARELAGGLNTGGDAGLFAASCSSAGNCAAGGYYQDSSSRQVPLLASEVHGTWQPVGHVPGIATLDVGPGEAHVTSVSCPSA